MGYQHPAAPPSHRRHLPPATAHPFPPNNKVQNIASPFSYLKYNNYNTYLLLPNVRVRIIGLIFVLSAMGNFKLYIFNYLFPFSFTTHRALHLFCSHSDCKQQKSSESVNTNIHLQLLISHSVTNLRCHHTRLDTLWVAQHLLHKKLTPICDKKSDIKVTNIKTRGDTEHRNQ